MNLPIGIYSIATERAGGLRRARERERQPRGRSSANWPSPDQFQCELNLARWGLSRSNQTGTGSGAPGLLEDNAIIDRRSEVGAVEYIEKLCPKLDVKILRDPPDTVVLEQGEVQVGEAGSNHRVTAQVAPQVGWIRKSQALCPDVVVGIAGIRECLAARTSHPIRRLGSLVEFHPQWVPA